MMIDIPLVKKELSSWTVENNSLTQHFEFDGFMSAFGFMMKIAIEAEIMNHHPNWSNSYNKVSISLTTHSKGEVTQLDIDFAKRIDSIYEKYN